jgi:hypothetical protein
MTRQAPAVAGQLASAPLLAASIARTPKRRPQAPVGDIGQELLEYLPSAGRELAYRTYRA